MINTAHFGKTPEGVSVERYSLTNQNKMQVDILTYGATIQRWMVPELVSQSGESKDIVLGFDDLASYLKDQSYIGRTVGRYANRIALGQFKINNLPYQVSTNLGDNSLHGGSDGFSARVWTAEIMSEGLNPSIKLSLVSEDGDQGFPGKLIAQVTFTLTEANSLRIEYTAESDQDTLYNPTQHSYFNLSGHDSGSIANQVVMVNADKFTPADNESIPTGEIKDVDGSAFDLRTPQPFAQSLALNDPDIELTNGLDHNWCVNGFSTDEQGLQNHIVEAAEVKDSKSGLCLTVKTSMPGIQVYTGNFIGENVTGKSGASYSSHGAFCLETQFYPDSPNQAVFPSARLKAGMNFYSLTEYVLNKV